LKKPNKTKKHQNKLKEEKMSGSIIEIINKLGVLFCDHALGMLIQSSILITVLLVIGLLLRKSINAVFRYCFWLLVFVKLVIPPTLSLPTGLGYWLGDLLPAESVSTETAETSTIENFAGSKLPYTRSPEPFISVPASEIPAVETNVIEAVAPAINTQGIIFIGWLIGELLLISLFLQKTFFVRRIIAQSKPAESRLQEILGDSCQKLGIRKKIELRISNNLHSPAACGLLSHKIILPVSLHKQFSSEKLRTTMLHELAHIKRKDIWVNYLQTLLQIFYFYNPLLWIANIIVRRIREQAVDETVMVYLGQKADTYSSTLVDIAEIAFAKPSLGLNMIGVVESKKALVARIRHITSRPFPTSVRLGAFRTIVIIIAAFIFLPMASATEKPASTWDLVRQAQTKNPDSNVTAKSTASVKTQTDERILHFPKDRSLGKLYLHNMEDPERFTFWTHWTWHPLTAQKEYFCEAKGDVKVPTDKKLSLNISYEASKDLSSLSNLKPDDLYGIMFYDAIQYPTAIDESMSFISKLIGLKVLYLNGTEITDTGMKFITNLKSLETLDLPDKITDKGMAYVGQLSSLKRLNFNANGSSRVSDIGLRQITKLKNLRELALAGDNMGDNGLVNVSELPQLEYLFIRGKNFGDKGMVHIKNMKSLKNLTFLDGIAYISDAGLANISEIPNLEILCLHGMRNITDKGITYLAKMKSLKKLQLGSVQITDKGIMSLSKIKTLECIEFPGDLKGITDTGVSYLAELPNLKTLSICPNSDTEYYTDKGLEAITHCRTLETLSMGSDSITDTGLVHLVNLINLQNLSLNCRNMTDEGMNYIAKLTSLKELSMDHCPKVTNKGAAKIIALNNLQSLYLEETSITYGGLSFLNNLHNMKVFYAKHILTDDSKMDISGLINVEDMTLFLQGDPRNGKIAYRPFRDEDWACLANLTKLKRLQITGAGISSEGIKYLAGLTNLEFLNIVCFGEKRINDEALKCLAGLNKIDRLIIRDGHFTDKALEYLSGMPALNSLELTSDIAFSKKAIANFQAKNPKIERIQLMP
jgi:beta-lactamase regulating signal transducer with metallopeptidase domain/Leucine-rich repeat (LRR) protein